MNEDQVWAVCHDLYRQNIKGAIDWPATARRHGLTELELRDLARRWQSAWVAPW